MINGSRLRVARKNKKLTQAELGKRLNLSKSTISCYENEIREPTVNTLIDIIELLGVSSDYLLGLDNIVKIPDEDVFHAITNEEKYFIDEMRKDKVLYEILFQDPKRGVEVVKNKIG